MKVLEFLKTKELNLNVCDYFSENYFYKFNSKNYDDGYLEKTIEFDFNDFIFKINVQMWFDFEATHKTSSAENDEEKNLEIFEITRCFIELLIVQRWDDEKMKRILLTETETEEIENYIKENIKLNS